MASIILLNAIQQSNIVYIKYYITYIQYNSHYRDYLLLYLLQILKYLSSNLQGDYMKPPIFLEMFTIHSFCKFS